MGILVTLVMREFRQLMQSVHGLGPFFLSLAGANALFLFFLRRAEGTTETLPSLWGPAVAFGLPFLASVASSRGFTPERECGMLRLMFSTPVRTRDWILSKVLAAWLLCLVYLAAMGLLCWILVHWQLPDGAEIPTAAAGFLPMLLMLILQALLWCSMGTCISLCSRSSAATFLLSLLSCLAIPPLVCTAVAAFDSTLMVQWPFFPLQSAVYDSACGLLSIRLAVGCLTGSAVLLFAAGILFDGLRLCATER